MVGGRKIFFAVSVILNNFYLTIYLGNLGFDFQAEKTSRVLFGALWRAPKWLEWGGGDPLDPPTLPSCGKQGLLFAFPNPDVHFDNRQLSENI